MILQPEFDTFVEKIVLGQPQVDKIERAVDTLKKYLGDAYKLPAENMFIQGSYSNGTAVRPPPTDGGEYDVDLVILSGSAAMTADQALDDLEKVLSNNGNYATRLKPKKPCVRIEYAEDDIGKFHIDVVPARIAVDQSVSPIEVPRREAGWLPSAPREYTEWCKSLDDNFGRTVQMFKRWRDENQTVRKAIKSIVLQVLVANALFEDDSDMVRISMTLQNMQNHLNAFPASPPQVPNPVLPSENLAARWENTAYLDFKTKLAEFYEASMAALNSNSEGEASEKMREQLGSDFPDTTAPPLSLGDWSHAKTAESEWIMQLDSGYHVSISASVWRSDSARSPFMLNYNSNGMPLKASWKIKYAASVHGPSDAEVRWEVVNTGAHAEFANGLRGDTFFQGKRLDGSVIANEPINWESTSYTGTHWIEAFLVRGGICLARSGRFLVNVDNPSRKFRFRR